MGILIFLIAAYFSFKLLGKAAPYVIIALLLMFLWKFRWIVLSVVLLGFIFYMIRRYVKDKPTENSKDVKSKPDTPINDVKKPQLPIESNVISSNTESKKNIENEVSIGSDDRQPIVYHRLRRSLADFVVLDIETTGLDIYTDEIIQVSALKFINDKQINSFNTFVKPKFNDIDTKIELLTGISNEDVNTAPSIEAVLPKLETFIGTLPIIGHNIDRFDVKFLVQKGFYLPEISTEDTVGMAWKKLSHLPNAKLPTLKKYYGIKNASHNSLNDCVTNAIIYKKLRDDDLDPIELDNSDIQKNIQGKRFAITGEFKGFSRNEIIEMIEQHGGKVTTSISGKTDYLVDGIQVANNLTDGIHSSTEIKAFDLISNNGHLEVINLEQLKGLLEDNLSQSSTKKFVSSF